VNRLRQKLSRRDSRAILWMRPQLSMLPLPLQVYDDPFLPFGKAIITASRDLVAGYCFDLASYLALGAAGMVALERTIPYANEDTITILHGPFASAGYVEAAGTNALNVDAVTLTDAAFASPYLDAGLEVFTISGSEETGRYSVEEQTLTLDNLTLHLLGDDVLYASRRVDFADSLRAAIQAHLL
jgi:hypothetical protein